MLARLLILMTVLVLLAGCAAPGIRAPEPLTAPAAWSARIDTSAVAAVPFAAWWEELGDDELNRLVGMALRENAHVSVAAARVHQARALAREAGANRLPQIDLGVAASRERVPRASLRDTEGGKATIPAFRQSRFATQLEARYEIDLLGRLALGERAAAADVAASDADLGAVRQWLAREVVLAYAELRLSDERAALAREATLRLGDLLRAEQERLKAGLVARERLREAERALAERNDSLIALGQASHAALSRLAELLGKTTGELQVQARADYFARLVLSGSVAPDLPATALERRADVAAAWQRVLGASDQAERARLDRYPALTLTGSTGFVSAAIRRWLTGDALAWVALAALQGPLFDGGRIDARAEQARAVVDEQQAEYRKLVVQALAEAETALSATQAAKEGVAFAVAELARREADRTAAADARSAGVGSRPMLVQSEVEQLAATESLSARRHGLLVAWANAQKALGR